MRYIALLALLLLSYLLCEEYRRFRARRKEELDALCRYLLVIEEEMKLYHTAKGPNDLSAYEALVRLGLGRDRPFAEQMPTVLSRAALLSSEKEKIKEFCFGFGTGNLETEQAKLCNIIENVKSTLQKEESEGKKSVDTVRIVAFTVVLCIVILFL